MSNDEEIWKRRFLTFALVRVAGLLVAILGLTISLTDLLRPGGWPLVGYIVAVLGLLDAVFAPKLLKKSWETK